MISCSGVFRFSTLIISIVMNSSSFWCLYLDSVSTLSFFPVSIVIFNNLGVSVMTLLNWLYFLVQFDLLCVGFVAYDVHSTMIYPSFPAGEI